METGIREGRTQPRVIMERIRPQIAAQRVADPGDSPFYKPFTGMPASIAAADRARLAAAGRAAIADAVLPAFARLDRFFNDRYAARLPHEHRPVRRCRTARLLSRAHRSSHHHRS